MILTLFLYAMQMSLDILFVGKIFSCTVIKFNIISIVYISFDFIFRALQFPPEAWLRICLKHGSITWLCILPSGRVTLFCLGDTGHMLPQNVTSS